MKAKTKKAKPGGLTFKDVSLPYGLLYEKMIKSSDFHHIFLSGLINLLILRTVLYCVLLNVWHGLASFILRQPQPMNSNSTEMVKNSSLLFKEGFGKLLFLPYLRI